MAQIYGAILRDLGLLSKGDVIVKVPADFVGSVLGESEKQTAAILDAAVGSVLVIDEAYGLYSGKGGNIYKVRASCRKPPSSRGLAWELFSCCLHSSELAGCCLRVVLAH